MSEWFPLHRIIITSPSLSHPLQDFLTLSGLSDLNGEGRSVINRVSHNVSALNRVSGAVNRWAFSSSQYRDFPDYSQTQIWMPHEMDEAWMLVTIFLEARRVNFTTLQPDTPQSDRDDKILKMGIVKPAGSYLKGILSLAFSEASIDSMDPDDNGTHRGGL